jgi:hypothetical protein
LIELFSRYNTGSASRGIANGYASAVIASIRAVKGARLAMPVEAEQPAFAPNPFSRPSRTGRELVFTTERK